MILRNLIVAACVVLVGQHGFMVSLVFIDEFQLILAMYINSVSIG